jgi:SAM-dependent methyltransferase
MGREAGHDARARVSASFDRIADLYTRDFADELDRKPFDRALLERLSTRLRGRGIVWEVGAGPAHVGGFMAARGVSLIASDISEGQVLEAQALGLVGGVLRCDLARLPAGPATLAAVVAFYCLIYDRAQNLEPVFADWRRALKPGGIVVAAFHGGTGEIHETEWRGRAVDLTVILHDPEAVASQLSAAGFVVEECLTRDPYEDEYPTTRCYLIAST